MSRNLHRHRPVIRLALKLAAVQAACAILSLCGCGTARLPALNPSLALSSATAMLRVGQQLTLQASGSASATGCTWTTSNPAVLASDGDGVFQGRAGGTAQATAACGGSSAHAAVVVSNATAGPLTITQGGTYSGSWTSTDPQTPAVLIQTNDPVVLRDATITSQGDLIDIRGSGAGAHVTVQNVTGTALDPGVAGLQRGSFVAAEQVASLKVNHCTMAGVRFGVKVLSSTATFLSITQNSATELEDRVSDGQGGLLAQRPDLGHFVMLNGVTAPNGAEIAWKQVIDTIGQSSTEDVFNIYKSQGTPTALINVHDNYMEGYSSTSSPSYTGSGLIADGDASQPVTAYVNFTANEMVHTAGSGVEIANGHDILARNNRVVSCGVDAAGNWYAMPFVNAVVVWNYYGAAQFSNLKVAGTVGGMLRPSATLTPEIADVWVRAADLDATDTVQTKGFADPCFVNGQLNLSAEDTERAFWRNKLATANITPGYQPTF